MRRSIISPLLHFLATSARKSEPSTAWTSYSDTIVSVIPASNHLQDDRSVKLLAKHTDGQYDTGRLAILLDHDFIPTCGPRPTKISYWDSKNTYATKRITLSNDEENSAFQHLGRRCLDLDFEIFLSSLYPLYPEDIECRSFFSFNSTILC